MRVGEPLFRVVGTQRILGDKKKVGDRPPEGIGCVLGKLFWEAFSPGGGINPPPNGVFAGAQIILLGKIHKRKNPLSGECPPQGGGTSLCFFFPPPKISWVRGGGGRNKNLGAHKSVPGGCNTNTHGVL